jgi:hypothetical protein
MQSVAGVFVRRADAERAAASLLGRGIRVQVARFLGREDFERQGIAELPNRGTLEMC